MPPIAVFIDRVFCQDTEDYTGEDEVYYISWLKCDDLDPGHPMDDPIPADIYTKVAQKVLDINSGEDKPYPSPDDELWSGDCPAGKGIVGSVYFIV